MTRRDRSPADVWTGASCSAGGPPSLPGDQDAVRRATPAASDTAPRARALFRHFPRARRSGRAVRATLDIPKKAIGRDYIAIRVGAQLSVAASDAPVLLVSSRLPERVGPAAEGGEHQWRSALHTAAAHAPSSCRGRPTGTGCNGRPIGAALRAPVTRRQRQTGHSVRRQPSQAEAVRYRHSPATSAPPCAPVTLVRRRRSRWRQKTSR